MAAMGGGELGGGLGEVWTDGVDGVVADWGWGWEKTGGGGG